MRGYDPNIIKQKDYQETALETIERNVMKENNTVAFKIIISNVLLFVLLIILKDQMKDQMKDENYNGLGKFSDSTINSNVKKTYTTDFYPAYYPPSAIKFLIAKAGFIYFETKEDLEKAINVPRNIRDIGHRGKYSRDLLEKYNYLNKDKVVYVSSADYYCSDCEYHWPYGYTIRQGKLTHSGKLWHIKVNSLKLYHNMIKDKYEHHSFWTFPEALIIPKIKGTFNIAKSGHIAAYSEEDLREAVRFFNENHNFKYEKDTDAFKKQLDSVFLFIRKQDC